MPEIPVLVHPLAVNVLRGLKYFWNLNGSSFILIFR